MSSTNSADLHGPENPCDAERSSEGCGEACSVEDHVVADLHASSFSGRDCFFGCPPLDERELSETTRGSVPLDVDEPDVRCHPLGIEEETEPSPWSESVSGAVAAIQLETRGTTSQKSKTFQRELWCRQTIHKNTVAAKLREFGRIELADGLEQCHTDTTWCVCKQCATAKPFLNRCERFYCPECQPTLSRDRERSVGWFAREMKQPKHVVLTLKNFPRINKRVVRWAKKAFGRLRRSTFCKNWVGGFYNWEVTKEVAGSVKNGHIMSGGWHLHIHILVEAQWIDSTELALQWARVTRGNGRIVKVMDARRTDYLKEVTKYAVKGNQLAAWSGAEIAMFIDAFTGVRTFGVFGSLYSKRTEFREWIKQLQQHKLKCKCGCEEFWYQTDWDYQTSGGIAIVTAPINGPNRAQLNLTLQ